MTFRTRITLWNLAVIALVLGGFGALLIYGVNVSVASSIDRDLLDRARPFRMLPPPDAVFGPPEGAPPVPPRPREETRPQIIDEQGRLAGEGTGARPWDMRAFERSRRGEDVFATATINGRRFRILSVPRGGGGVAQLARDLTDFDLLRARQIQTLLFLMPVALIVAAVGAVFLSGRVLKPVRDVTLAARGIDASELSRRLKHEGSDELALMAATFNSMLDRLENAFKSRQEAYEQLQLAFEQQKRFTADASHELRTPLARIKVSTSAALSAQQTTDEYKRALEVADSAADAMDRLIEQLLTLARADAGILSAHADKVSAAELLDAVRKNWPEPRIVFKSNTGNSVRVDRHLIERVFDNLLENAARHCPGGAIEVGARDESDGVAFIVSDSGDGIAPEHLPHLFERFYRADMSRTRASGGAGLGLAICKSIVEGLGGKISIVSEARKGTAVTVTLPRA